MRSFIYFFAILYFCPSIFADDDFIGWRISDFKESSYKFAITKSAIEKAAKWSPQDQSPPLTPKKAFQIALAQAKHLRPEVTNWNNSEIRLTPVCTNTEKNGFDGKWIYMIKLQDFSGSFYGVPWQLDIPVYLDGSTITPQVEKSRRYKAEQGAAANP